ncbi:MAG: ATP-dependent DNA helicase [Rhodospirillaceae bacterium]
MYTVDEIFSSGGALAHAVEGYRERPFQLDMARAIAQAIEDRGVFVAEAGTGTGKTFAYLVPALLSGGKVIISTGTKTLQDQLYGRDLPRVCAALRTPAATALLKGRANYVCHHYLERSLAEARLPSAEDAVHLQRVASFARVSATGDRAECGDVPETAGVWSYVTSSRENCLGANCKHYERCFVMRARKQALEADVVVVNHHLFFADLVLRDEGVGELLPACNTVIFDEAHQLPETASLFFGESTSTSQLIELARDLRVEAAAGARDARQLPAASDRLEKAARDLRLVFRDIGRLTAQTMERNTGFRASLDDVLAALDHAADVLEPHASRSEGLQRCRERAFGLAEQLERWRSESDGARVKWLEVFGHSVQLNATPLSVADIFREQVTARGRACIFASATLSVAGDFSHYCSKLGLDSAVTARWNSPFDYGRQALLYVPNGLPEPNTPEHTEAVVRAALPLVKASRGRAFLLFTSLRAMRDAHTLLRATFEADGVDFPLLVQGEGSRSELLDRFRRLGNAVLLGSHSFWEGVDVRGEALSLVVIDKLPFAAPDDPVLSARIEQLRREGRNAFMEYQLPEAVLKLKQGAGRLIRDEGDRGVLVICDPRIATKTYGRRVVASLPPMRRTRDAAEAIAFFNTPATAESTAIPATARPATAG